MIYRIRRDFRNNWRWYLETPDGRRLATGESYRSRVDCEQSLFMVRQSATAVVEMGEDCHTYLLDPSVRIKSAPPWKCWHPPRPNDNFPMSGCPGAES